MIRGIIFDCFGVLYVDVTKAYFSRFPEHYEELHDLNKMSDHGFIDKQAYISRVARITGISEVETLEGFAQEHVLNTALADYIPGLRSTYKVGLLSNVGRGWIEDFFNKHQLHDLFDEVVLSSEEGITKPNPMVFERTAQRLGLLPEECVMIDDHQENCIGAEAVGMKSILFSTNEALKTELEGLLAKKELS